MKKEVIYQATVTSENNNKVETYIGLTATKFKERWWNHMSSMRTRNGNNSTLLLKYVWVLQDKKFIMISNKN